MLNDSTGCIYGIVGVGAESNCLKHDFQLSNVAETEEERRKMSTAGISDKDTSRKKNGFVTAIKLGTNKFFVAATKKIAAASKRFVDRTKHFIVVTKCFCYPYFNK